MAPEIQATLTMDTIYRLCLLGGRFKFHNESVRLVEWRRFISQRICRTLKLTTRIIPIPKRHRASKAPEARMTRSFIRESLITTKKTALFLLPMVPNAKNHVGIEEIPFADCYLNRTSFYFNVLPRALHTWSFHCLKPSTSNHRHVWTTVSNVPLP